MQLACEAQWCSSCLSVEGHGLAADLRVLRRPAIRILDHEVRVNRQDAGLHDGFRDGQTPREVGDEMVVHDVDMSDIRSCDLGELTAQIGDIAVENRRANCGVHNAYASACAGKPQT